MCLIVDSAGNVYGMNSCKNPSFRPELSKSSLSVLQPLKIYSKKSFRGELIYSGKQKDIIYLKYREYNDDMARPAFYQDLVYDLSWTNVILFKDLQIEFVDAASSSIKYKVIKW